MKKKRCITKQRKFNKCAFMQKKHYAKRIAKQKEVRQKNKERLSFGKSAHIFNHHKRSFDCILIFRYAKHLQGRNKPEIKGILFNLSFGASFSVSCNDNCRGASLFYSCTLRHKPFSFYVLYFPFCNRQFCIL